MDSAMENYKKKDYVDTEFRIRKRNLDQSWSWVFFAISAVWFFFAPLLVFSSKINIWIVVIVSISLLSCLLTFVSRKESTEMKISKRDIVLYYLYKFSKHANKYASERNIREYREAKKALKKLKATVATIDVESFGSAWEKSMNIFFENLELYLEINIVPKFKETADTDLIKELRNDAFEIFSVIYEEEFLALPDRMESLVAQYISEKTTIWMKFLRWKEKGKSWIPGTVLVLIFGIAYWSIAKFLGWSPTFHETVIVAAGLPAAFYYARLWLTAQH